MFGPIELLTPEVMASAWVDIVRSRNSYLFLTEWGLTHHLFWLEALVFWLVARHDFLTTWSAEKRRVVYLLVLIPLALTALSFITVDFFELSTFVQVQLLRSQVMLKITLVILFAYYAWRTALREPKPSLFNVFLLGIVAALLVKELIVLIMLPFFTLLWWERQQAGATKADLMPVALHHGIFIGAFAASAYIATLSRPFLGPLLITTLLITGLLMALVYWHQAHPRRAVFLGIIIALVYVSNPTLGPGGIKPPLAYDTQFIAACAWIQHHTPPQAIFVAEPFSGVGEDVKLLCQRNLYYSGKDGAQVLFDEQYAYEWQRRKDLLVKQPSEAATAAALLMEDIDYVISIKPIDQLSRFEVFSNTSYFIYQLSSQPRLARSHHHG